MSTSYKPPEEPPTTYKPQLDVGSHFSLERKSAVLLHPRFSPNVDRFESKMGGEIAWPRSEQWPHCEEHKSPFVTVLQLTKKSVPELPFPRNTDLFQLLWCPLGHDGPGMPQRCIRWRVTSLIVDVLDRPQLELTHKNYPGIPNDYWQVLARNFVPRECVLYPERVDELYSDIEDKRMYEIENWIMENGKEDLDAMGLTEEIENFKTPSTKVGGFPSFVQDPFSPECECGTKMSHLLTLASGDIGDGDTKFRWRPSDVEGDAGMCNLPHGVEGPNLMLGDMGSVYIFVCLSCENMPSYTSLQCC
eukprot:IDg14163t1